MDHFGFIGSFFAMDLAARASEPANCCAGRPGPTLIEDIDAGAYFH